MRTLLILLALATPASANPWPLVPYRIEELYDGRHVDITGGEIRRHDHTAAGASYYLYDFELTFSSGEVYAPTGRIRVPQPEHAGGDLLLQETGIQHVPLPYENVGQSVFRWLPTLEDGLEIEVWFRDYDNFGGQLILDGPAPIARIPEPTTGLLAILALAGASGLRCRGVLGNCT